MKHNKPTRSIHTGKTADIRNSRTGLSAASTSIPKSISELMETRSTPSGFNYNIH